MDYGLDPKQLVRYVIRPVLQQRLDLWSPSAEVLVLGTALVESNLKFIDQIDKANNPGPAFGLWQCEGPTHADHYRNFLAYNFDLKQRVIRLASFFSGDFPDPRELSWNLAYACAICRIHYRRKKAALPPAHNATAMAEYWKREYNGPGKGTVAKAIPHFEFAINLEV